MREKMRFRKWIIILFYLFSVKAFGDEDECYKKARCGKGEPVVRFPFRLVNKQPAHCGYPGFDLFCTNSHRTALKLPNFNTTVFISKILYQSLTLKVHNPRKCDFPKNNFQFLNLSMSRFQFLNNWFSERRLFNCSNLPSDGPTQGTTCFPCLSGRGYHVCAFYSPFSSVELANLVSCMMIDFPSIPTPEVYEPDGIIDLIWTEPNCSRCESRNQRCRSKRKDGQTTNETECFKISRPQKGAMIISSVTAGSLVLVVATVLIFHGYKRDKSDRENRKRIKKFIEDYEAFNTSRYMYNDLKKITNQFKEEVGQGAYGTVFKGKLSNEVFVAVKMLNNNFQGNDEQFVNEVATIGRIHHVNIVRLVGYCAEGVRRALIYEFLPNQSLDNHTTPDVIGGEKSSLSWKTMRDIAIGIAKGIEYLHQGCEQRILHFDIKPRNILLDKNFIPKISDFGLAKLCSKDQSAVSMTKARGTMGYIAPEVFSRNFGKVSYKSDVYSFGMLLLEMVGKRKNCNATINNNNVEEIHYPEWIYNLLEEGEDHRIQIDEEGGGEIAKRLAVVGLWCIQWIPIGRPSMKVVVSMLEGEEGLMMPPNPFASTASSSAENKIFTTFELEAIAE